MFLILNINYNLVIYVEFLPHNLTMGCRRRKIKELPEDGQHLRPKHVAATINNKNIVQQNDNNYYLYIHSISHF